MMIEHLKALRAGQDRIEGQVRELTGRMRGVEHQLTGIHSDMAGVQLRLDRHDDRLVRSKSARSLSMRS